MLIVLMVFQVNVNVLLYFGVVRRCLLAVCALSVRLRELTESFDGPEIVSMAERPV